MTAAPAVTVYTRAGCHLCEEALTQLRPLADELGFRIEEVDIESDDVLHRRYLERIPVIALEGRELSDFFLDEGALRAALA